MFLAVRLVAREPIESFDEDLLVEPRKGSFSNKLFNRCTWNDEGQFSLKHSSRVYTLLFEVLKELVVVGRNGDVGWIKMG